VSLHYFFAVSPSCGGRKSASFQSSYLLDKSPDLQKCVVIILPRWKFASGRYQLRCHFLQLLQSRCSLHIELVITVLVCRVIILSCRACHRPN
jgi:hypothetical protein